MRWRLARLDTATDTVTCCAKKLISRHFPIRLPPSMHVALAPENRNMKTVAQRSLHDASVADAALVTGSAA
jgi:hypothetical protein